MIHLKVATPYLLENNEMLVNHSSLLSKQVSTYNKWKYNCCFNLSCWLGNMEASIYQAFLLSWQHIKVRIDTTIISGAARGCWLVGNFVDLHKEVVGSDLVGFQQELNLIHNVFSYPRTCPCTLNTALQQEGISFTKYHVETILSAPIETTKKWFSFSQITVPSSKW